jgi:hypothetical protein
MEAKRAAAQHVIMEHYKKANDHPNYITTKKMPDIRYCATRVHSMIANIQSTSNFVEKVKKIINLYDYTLNTITFHTILATSPSIRLTTLGRITEFCDYLPYNTTLLIQRNRFRQLYLDLMRHMYYVPDPV